MPAAETIPKKNECFVLHAIRDVRFEERPKPTLAKDTDVIVVPRKTGICGSDTHYLVHGRIGDFILDQPMTLGHESSGVIVEVGKAVKDLKPGDRVALEPGETCRRCVSCKAGHPEQCPEMIFAATPPFTEGTLAGYYTLPADLCYKIPDNVPLEEGALVEPLSVAVMAVSRVGEMPHNANVVVFGAALGARFVLGVDIQAERLAFAKEYAASDTYLPSATKEGEARVDYSRRQADEMKAKFGFDERGPGGVDLVVDCTGAEVCIQTGIHLLKHGGTFVQVGNGNPNITVPITQILNKGLHVKGSFRYGPGIYPLAIDLLARGLLSLKPLITHRYTFKEAKEAFHANETGKGADGKTVIKAIIDGPLDD
ncbi:xylitol dehydrogenase [Pseudohyphozyma bogoriensis]|nr:xylitol dehydrogenase [Pseudohyphozyma bogoriensis]